MNSLIKSYVLSAGSFVSFFVAFALGISEGQILIDTDVTLPVLIGVIVLLFLEALWPVVKNETIAMYLKMFITLFYLLVAFFVFPILNLFLIFLIAVLISFYGFFLRFGIRGVSSKKFLASSIVFIIMMFLATLLRENFVPENIGILVGSVYDDVLPGGVTFMFQNGLVFFSKYFVVTISPQTILLFSLLSALLVENYVLIFRYVGRHAKSVLGGHLTQAVSVVSCQCESLVAAFPSIVTLLLSFLALPLILESVVLAGITNFLLRRRFLPSRSSRILQSLWPIKRRSIFILTTSIFLLAIPVVEIIGIYYGLQNTLYFYGSINFLMLLGGTFFTILLLELLTVKGRDWNFLTVSLLAVGTVAMFVWFIPYLVAKAVVFPGIFALMNISSFLSGVVFGIAYVFSNSGFRKVIIEYIPMMFTLFAMVIFFFSVVTSYTVWPVFGLIEQFFFSISVWLVFLPIMWLSTVTVLNTYVVEKRERTTSNVIVDIGIDHGE